MSVPLLMWLEGAEKHLPSPNGDWQIEGTICTHFTFVASREVRAELRRKPRFSLLTDCTVKSHTPVILGAEST